MEALFWGCFITGILFTVVTLVIGELLSSLTDSLEGHGMAFLHPVVLIGGLTIFGGSGIMLLRYTPLGPVLSLLLAICIALCLSTLTWFLYVKPMKQSENSTAFSRNGLIGKIAEVTVSIPESGYGEVIIRVGAAGLTNQIAASLEGTAITGGSRVVIVEVKGEVLFVSLLE